MIYMCTGEYEMKRLDEAGRRQYERYGEIVRENLGGTHVVHLFNPDDIQTVFRLEGKFPMRKSHTALAKYRLQCPHLYNDGGLLPTFVFPLCIHTAHIYHIY